MAQESEGLTCSEMVRAKQDKLLSSTRDPATLVMGSCRCPSLAAGAPTKTSHPNPQ